MGKWWPLFLSLLGVAQVGHAQQQPAQDQAALAKDCSNKVYQDSLVARYLDRGAHRVSYLSPQWAQYCDSLIAACPTIAYAYQQKAMPLIKCGDYAKAFPLIDQAVALDVNRWLAYRGFLKCIFTKDYAGALTDFRRVAQLKPQGREMDHTYAFFMGLCNLEMGKYKDAEADFAEDMRLQLGADGRGEIHFNTLLYAGVLALKKKQYPQAQTHLERCLKAYSQHPEANYYLALAYQAQGKPALARQHLAASQRALIGGYRLNEDNIYYANYPGQITEFEVIQAQKKLAD
ncbi:tetratricopeptide repeat protein [Hymenobacter arizonensis]|uniref:TPR repeat-containing protein n=1 Tax=Hymenobacter arizonensis TaxID=1227077 RepID=A0A1I5Z311_HYMAR|nr:tetratricopeptide repeat protein [Hymenobacter arizonensis]SFQ50842.1 TPR repeat-containing protein [Hymenobacter arizonensis]